MRNEVAASYFYKPGRYVQDPDCPNAFCWTLNEPFTVEEIRKNDQPPLNFSDKITDKNEEILSEEEDSNAININTAVTLQQRTSPET